MATGEGTSHDCDVLVIGGGPAGSTAAALLAQQGRHVVLVEKEHHPRFHIGESLLPLNLPVLERLGVLEQVREIGVIKYGAEFNSDNHRNTSTTFYFAEAMDKSHPYAFQVRRAEFDHLLLRNAAGMGADVREGFQVTEVVFEQGRPALVQARDEQHRAWSWRPRFLIDASGRDTFLGSRLKLKRKNPRHQSAAIFSHFENVDRRAGRDEGNISICWFAHGWFWMIPLRDGSMSIGAVCWPEYLKQRDCSPEDFLWKTIAQCPAVQQRMTDARMIAPARATGNYSYGSARMYGDGYLLVGDAYAFVDPVFSSGVFLAMNGAAESVEVVDRCLREPHKERRLLARHQRRIDRGIRTIAWFIHRFNSPIIHSLFMAPRNVARMQEAVISVLAGDFYRKSHIAVPLTLFKALYFTSAVVRFRRAWQFARQRRMNVHTRFRGGTTAQDAES